MAKKDSNPRKFDGEYLEVLGFERYDYEDRVFKKLYGYDAYCLIFTIHQGCTLNWDPETKIITYQLFDFDDGQIYYKRYIKEKIDLLRLIQTEPFYKKYYVVLGRQSLKNALGKFEDL